MDLRRFLIFVLFIASLPSAAYAWHDKGHRATASIAFDQLAPEFRDVLWRIMTSHPRFAEDFDAHLPASLADQSVDIRLRWYLEQAATWPDLIQDLDDDVRQAWHRGRWHYINIPIYLTPEDEGELADSLDHNMATEFEAPMRQNLNIIQALRGNLQIWHSDTSTDAERAVALCWILHLVGDLHQPLHTVALFSQAYFPKGDRGGNSVNVAMGNETWNLHSVWDSRPTTIDDFSPTSSTLWRLANERSNDPEIERWLSRHVGLARRYVYTNDVKQQLLDGLSADEFPAIRLSDAYLADARALAEQQVILAGFRIAALLEMQ